MYATPEPLQLLAFTDGSSIPGARRPGGWSSIVFDQLRYRAALGGYCKASGMNFLSEITSILATFLSCPAQADLDLWSDCKGAIQAIERDDSSERNRIRAAARPVLTSIRRALRCRAGLGSRTTLHHIRSHTNGDSFEEKGNALADVRANQERRAASSFSSEPFLTGEEMFTAWLPNDRGRYVHVIGDVRKALKQSVKRAALRRWCAKDLQGRTPAAHPDGASRLCVLIRRLRSSTLLR